MGLPVRETWTGYLHFSSSFSYTIRTFQKFNYDDDKGNEDTESYVIIITIATMVNLALLQFIESISLKENS